MIDTVHKKLPAHWAIILGFSIYAFCYLTFCVYLIVHMAVNMGATSLGNHWVCNFSICFIIFTILFNIINLHSFSYISKYSIFYFSSSPNTLVVQWITLSAYLILPFIRGKVWSSTCLINNSFNQYRVYFRSKLHRKILSKLFQCFKSLVFII